MPTSGIFKVKYILRITTLMHESFETPDLSYWGILTAFTLNFLPFYHYSHLIERKTKKISLVETALNFTHIQSKCPRSGGGGDFKLLMHNQAIFKYIAIYIVVSLFCTTEILGAHNFDVFYIFSVKFQDILGAEFSNFPVWHGMYSNSSNSTTE